MLRCLRFLGVDPIISACQTSLIFRNIEFRVAAENWKTNVWKVHLENLHILWIFFHEFHEFSAKNIFKLKSPKSSQKWDWISSGHGSQSGPDQNQNLNFLFWFFGKKIYSSLSRMTFGNIIHQIIILMSHRLSIKN